MTPRRLLTRFGLWVAQCAGMAPKAPSSPKRDPLTDDTDPDAGGWYLTEPEKCAPLPWIRRK